MEADLHDVYGIDLDDPQLLAGRSWPWLRLRIRGLLTRPMSPWSIPTRVQAALMPMEVPSGVGLG